MEMFPIAWMSVLAAPPVMLALFWSLRRGAPGLVRALGVASVAFLGMLIGSTIIGLGFTLLAANVLCWTLGYWAYCFLAASCLLIPSEIARIAALVVTAIPILIGYVLGTVGALGLAFILGDVTETPYHTEQMGPGLTCRMTKWGMAASDSGYTVELYKAGPLPFLERKVASINVTQTDPSSKEASCADALALYGR